MTSNDYEVVFVFETCYLGTNVTTDSEDEDYITELAKGRLHEEFGTILDSVIDLTKTLDIKIEKTGEYL